MHDKVTALPVHKYLLTLPGVVARCVFKSMLVSLISESLLRGKFNWRNSSVCHAHDTVRCAFSHVADLHRASWALHHSVSKAKLDRHSRDRRKVVAKDLQIGPRCRHPRRRLDVIAREMGKDFGAKIEAAVEDLGTFHTGAVNSYRDKEALKRGPKATWSNIAKRVTERIGGGFTITGGSVRHYCAAKWCRSAEAAHVEDVMQNDANSDGSDIVCSKCLSGETAEDNDILICDGAHSQTTGYHQKCYETPLLSIPDCSWICPECSVERSDVASRLRDSDYAPSPYAASSSGTSMSTSTSSSSTDSDTDATSSDSASDCSISASDSSDSSDSSRDAEL